MALELFTHVIISFKMAAGQEGDSTLINATGTVFSCRNSISPLYYLAHLGNDRPLIKDLHDHVVLKVAHKWKDLGVQLLRPDQQERLDIIKSDHSQDSVECCKCVFKKWLDSNDDATWNQLTTALRSPSVELHNLATQIEGKMIEECEIIEILYTFYVELLKYFMYKGQSLQ